MRQGSNRFYYHLDHLGSVIALTNANGDQVGQRYEYEPYGKQIAGQTQVDNPWRFASGFHDNVTGFLKFGTRYYDSGAMRWSQPDVVHGRLADPPSLNRYTYVGGNPVSRTDPSGRVVYDYPTVYFSESETEAIAQGSGAVAAILGGASYFIPNPVTLPIAAGAGILSGVANLYQLFGRCLAVSVIGGNPVPIPYECG